MKQWLLAGLKIAEDADDGQFQHVRGCQYAGFPDKSEAEVDAEMRRVIASGDYLAIEKTAVDD